jgi:hypothetical protein
MDGQLSTMQISMRHCLRRKFLSAFRIGTLMGSRAVIGVYMIRDRKRFVLALFFGLLSGCICYLGRYLFFDFENNMLNFLWILLNRTMIGFVIGISKLRVHWAIHGILIGAVVGSIFPFYVYMRVGDLSLVGIVYLLSILFGLFIEFFTSVIFKAKLAEERG